MSRLSIRNFTTSSGFSSKRSANATDIQIGMESGGAELAAVASNVTLAFRLSVSSGRATNMTGGRFFRSKTGIERVGATSATPFVSSTLFTAAASKYEDAVAAV